MYNIVLQLLSNGIECSTLRYKSVLIHFSLHFSKALAVRTFRFIALLPKSQTPNRFYHSIFTQHNTCKY